MHVVPVVLSLIGCFGGDEAAPEADGEVKPSVEAPAPAEPEPAEDQIAYVTGETILRKIASDEKKIDDPATGSKVNNWVATLYRGEEVVVIGEDGDWTQVRLSDAKEGWLKKDRTVVAEHPVATVYEAGKIFQRPDLLTLDPARKIEPGALVFVIQDKEQFSEVDFPKSGYSSNRGWTLTSELVSEKAEVDAAKLIAKVLHLRAKNDESAKQLEDLARSQFGGSRLITLLDTPTAPPVEGAPGAPVEGSAEAPLLVPPP